MPFEGAGAISTWRLELPATIRPFNYSSIADVVLHVSYTARDGGAIIQRTGQRRSRRGPQRLDAARRGGVTQKRLLSFRRDFPAEWHALTSTADGQPQKTTIALSKRHFPRYLDYLWTRDGSTMEASPITIAFASPPLEAILDPAGSPTEEVPVIRATGLSDISNDEGTSLTIEVVEGTLATQQWQDLYLLLRYEVVA